MMCAPNPGHRRRGTHQSPFFLLWNRYRRGKQVLSRRGLFLRPNLKNLGDMENIGHFYGNFCKRIYVKTPVNLG